MNTAVLDKLIDLLKHTPSRSYRSEKVRWLMELADVLTELDVPAGPEMADAARAKAMSLVSDAVTAVHSG